MKILAGGLTFSWFAEPLGPRRLDGNIGPRGEGVGYRRYRGHTAVCGGMTLLAVNNPDKQVLDITKKNRAAKNPL